LISDEITTSGYKALTFTKCTTVLVMSSFGILSRL
jgi:hypothetical protein